MLELKFQQVVHKIDSKCRLLGAWELHGGISAQVTALEIQLPDGQIVKLVLRLYGDADLKHNPRVAADEYKLLQILHTAGLATPVPYLLDQSSEIFPKPYIVIEYIEGEPDFAPTHDSGFALQLAIHLSRIHQVDGDSFDLSFLASQERVSAEMIKQRPAHLDGSLDEGRIRDVLESVWPLPVRNKHVLLHGDYWPGNILWRDAQLVAIIDWEDAKMGDPLADLGNTRLEMLWAYGEDAMQRFTDHYQSVTATDITHLPYWDLCAALRPASKISEWAANDGVEKRMRERHRAFITQAFKKLNA
jgi:aminoglycoside phosphotransferase (APT) family kinase protein